jgi:hypothetical protein
MEPQCLGQGVVDGGAVIAELLPQRLLDLGLIEKGVRHTGATQTLLRLRDDDIRRGRRGAGR